MGVSVRLCRLQSADAALYLAGTGKSPVTLLEINRFWGVVSVWLHRLTDDLLAALPVQWPSLSSLNIAGEQRQRLQAGDIRAYRG